MVNEAGVRVGDDLATVERLHPGAEPLECNDFFTHTLVSVSSPPGPDELVPTVVARIQAERSPPWAPIRGEPANDPQRPLPAVRRTDSRARRFCRSCGAGLAAPGRHPAPRRVTSSHSTGPHVPPARPLATAPLGLLAAMVAVIAVVAVVVTSEDTVRAGKSCGTITEDIPATGGELAARIGVERGEVDCE